MPACEYSMPDGERCVLATNPPAQRRPPGSSLADLGRGRALFMVSRFVLANYQTACLAPCSYLVDLRRGGPRRQRDEDVDVLQVERRRGLVLDVDVRLAAGDAGPAVDGEGHHRLFAGLNGGRKGGTQHQNGWLNTAGGCGRAPLVQLADEQTSGRQVGVNQAGRGAGPPAGAT